VRIGSKTADRQFAIAFASTSPGVPCDMLMQYEELLWDGASYASIPLWKVDIENAKQKKSNAVVKIKIRKSVTVKGKR